VTATQIRSLDEILRQQLLIASRGQLLDHGVDDRAMTRRVRRGEWQRPVPGIYVLEPAPLTSEQRRIVASLYLGDDCQITGPSALHWYGFRHVPATDRVHALVPHERRRRSTGPVLVMRTRELDPRARAAGLYQVASPARASVDAARTVSDLTFVRAILTEAVQRGHTDVTAISDELRRAKRSRTALANRVLGELLDGARSSPEAELRSLVRASHRLPPALWNPILVTHDGTRLPSPDGYLAQAGLAIEVDSVEHHLGGEDLVRTLDRGNILSRYGILVLHFTPTEIRSSPRRVLRMIEATYRQRTENAVTVPVTATPRAEGQ
jgi:hypothetical protein